MFYKPLTKKEIFPIIDLMLKSLQNRLKDKQITLNVTDAAKTYIADNGYDPVYGARPLKRYIQSTLETMLAKKIIADEIEPYSTVKIDCVDNELTINS